MEHDRRLLLRSIGALTLAAAIASLACAEAMPGDVLLDVSPPVIDLNQHGLTGSWYQPAMSGQGILLEVYPNAVGPGIGFLHGSWFTFKPIAYWDYDNEHRWYTFSGNAPAGQSSATLTVYRNVGGNFNALPATSAVAIGNAVLSFQDCASARLEYAFIDGGFRSGIIPLVRLTPNVTCSTGVETLTNADFTYSGHWFDPATSGQGVVVEVNPIASTLFLGWFTYKPDGQSQGAEGQRWYSGQEHYVPGAASATVTLYETIGNSFDSGDPKSYTFHVGTATATFVACDAASLTFAFTGGSNAGQSGTINLVRAGPTPPDCEGR